MADESMPLDEFDAGQLASDIPVGAIVGAAVVSVVAGAFPARQASRLPAREAVEA